MARQPRSRNRSKVSECRDETAPGTRKRTLVLSLLALGAGAVTIGTLASSSDGDKSANKLFTTQAQCERDSAAPKEECGKQFTAALQAHEKASPKFPSKESCEQEHGAGQCVNPSTNTNSVYRSYYIPAMSGYLMGRTSTGGYQSAPLYRKRADPPGSFRQMAPFPNPRTTPASRTPTGTSGSAFRNRSWRSSSSGTRVSSPSRSTYRGGFGRSSRGYSGG